MALSRLGDYIELVDVKNTNDEFDYRSLRGISINKILIPTKATGTENLNLKGYKIVRKGQFTYCTVTSRNGNKISIAYNDEVDCIVSSINLVFKIKNIDKLLPRYLMMFFNRTEFDRYARFNSWGSARETFSWEDLCDTLIEVPSIETQTKYVNIYESILNNIRIYESELSDLKLVCDGYIENLRRIYGDEPIGKYIEEISNKNYDSKITNILGISKDGFIPPKQRPGDLANYYIFNKNNFVYSPPRINVGSIGLYKEDKTAVCSPIYVTFRVKNEEKLNPDYLMMWLRRNEFLRSTDFYSIASVRNNFSFDLMCETKIAMVDLSIQNSIVSIFKALNERKKFIDSLKEKIKNICPILIRGAIKEAKGGD